MVLKGAALVYFAQSLLPEARAALLEEFNHPETAVGRENPIRFDPANVDVLGKSVSEIAALHREKLGTASARGVSDVDGSLIVVVDDGVSPCSHPRTVLLVKLAYGSEGDRAGNAAGECNQYQNVRVLTSNVALVLAAIACGEHGWDDVWNVAKANGGHFPGE